MEPIKAVVVHKPGCYESCGCCGCEESCSCVVM